MQKKKHKQRKEQNRTTNKQAVTIKKTIGYKKLLPSLKYSRDNKHSYVNIFFFFEKYDLSK